MKVDNDNKGKNKIILGFIWKFSERILSQLITMIVSIILARILIPEDYGIVALVAVFINIADVLVSGGFPSALIQKKDASTIDFSTIFYFNIIFSLGIYITIFWGAPEIAKFYDNNEITSVLRVIAIKIPISAISSIEQAYVSKKMQFKKIFYSTFVGSIISAIIGLYMAYARYGVWALVSQELANMAISTITLFFMIDWRPTLNFSWTCLNALIRYGWKIMASSLLNAFYNEMRSLIIGRKYSTEDLSYYNQGLRYPKLVVNNTSAAIETVLFSAMSENQDDKQRVKEMTRKSIRIGIYVMSPLLIGLAIIAEPLVSILLTDKWLACVPYIQIGCISYILLPVQTANLQAIKSMGYSDLYLKMEIIKKCVGVASVLFLMNYGVFAIACSWIVSTIIASIVNTFPNRKLLEYTYKEQLIDIMPTLALSLIMVVVGVIVGEIVDNMVLKLIMQILLCAGSYIGLSKIFKMESFEYLLRMIMNIKKTIGCNENH